MHRKKQWKHDNPKPMGFNKSSDKRKVNSDINIPQKTIKMSNKQPTLHLKQLEKEQKTPKLVEEKKLQKSEKK